MVRRNLDTAGTGKRALLLAQTLVHDFGHIFQPIDSDVDIGIDGYIRLRKKIKFKKTIKNKLVAVEDFVDTGKLIGVQVKGVTSIPAKGSNSYYITLSDKEKFGVNFSNRANLEKHKTIWRNFIGPVILLFVDLESNQCWWGDLESPESYAGNDYSVSIPKKNVFDSVAFLKIKKLGRESFAATELMSIDAKNYHFNSLSITDFKNSAKDAYSNLSGSGEFYFETENATLGTISYSRSGWNHITRLNRNKMRILNSIFLLGISKSICENVKNYSFVKKGAIRESKRFIKKAEYLTLRAHVKFGYRQSTIVQVVLRRIKTFDKINTLNKIDDKIFFHSVYEPYRKD